MSIRPDPLRCTPPRTHGVLGLRAPRGERWRAPARVAPGRAALATVGLLLALTACSKAGASDATFVASQSPSDGPVVVHLFGDSLTWESEGGLREQLGDDYDLRVTAFGGIGLCDLDDQIVETAENGAADVILVQLSGNAYTPCTYTEHGPPDEDERLARYRDDTSSLIDAVTGTDVPLIIVGSPPMPEGHARTPDDDYRRLVADAEERGLDVSYLDAGAALEAPGGGWAGTLPCLPDESAAMGCADGQIPVRGGDEVHFCPGALGEADGTITACDRWSSGAWRYASAMAAEVRGRFPGP